MKTAEVHGGMHKVDAALVCVLIFSLMVLQVTCTGVCDMLLHVQVKTIICCGHYGCSECLG